MRRFRVWLLGIVGSAIFWMVAGAEAKDISVLQETGSAFAQIAQDALPAVVFIDVETTVEVRQYHDSHPFGDFFGHDFFRVPEQYGRRKYSQLGQGSGFIITKDGYILTNNHVVGDADRIAVTLSDGRKFDARLVGTDPKSEVALIKIDDGDDFPFIPLGDSDVLKVGDWVLAAGNPFGLSQTITAGIVSAKGRCDVGIAEYGNFIQTDAAINPGNSGGPLLNIHGEVVGINTAIYTRTGGYMGIGFAIPINQAIQIKDQLIAHGRVSRSVLGVYIQQLDEDLARSFGLEQSGGILISQIMEGSAAQEAGLREGDIIVELNGQEPGKVSAFRNRVASIAPSTSIDLKIYRDGKYQTISAVTKAMDGDEIAVEPVILEQLGLEVEGLEGDAARRLGYKDEQGILITQVDQGGVAWRAGLKSGYIILSVNRKPVNNVGEFNQVLSELGECPRILFLVTDGRSSRFIVVALD